MQKGIIESIAAREILDSRGQPTVEVDVYLKRESPYADGYEPNVVMGHVSVPSGASTGMHEAHELRDNDERRFKGKGVLKAVHNVRDIIAPRLRGMNAFNQDLIDQTLIDIDGTPHKSYLGANAMLGVSMACAKACSLMLNVPLFSYIGGVRANVLPIPMMNVINGGMHADNDLDIQEFMIMPIGATSFREGLQVGSEVFHTLKSLLRKQGLGVNVGDEGGFAPSLRSHRQTLDIMMEAIELAGYKPGVDVALALDAAATSFFDSTDRCYYLKETGAMNSHDMVDYWCDLIEDYPIISLEDGMHEEDMEGWFALTQTLGKKIQLVGDDIFVTNPEKLTYGIEHGLANAVLIKPNQIGTLTETITTLEKAFEAGYNCVVSHRSGETEDTTIADLAVGMRCGQIKTGSLSRSERLAKYNQLLRIEEIIGDKGRYGFGLSLDGGLLKKNTNLTARDIGIIVE